MNTAKTESLKIIPYEEKYLNDVVRIHQDVLSYTFNSRLGFEHLSFVYKTMAQDKESYVGVALFENQPVGVISGTLSTDTIKTLLLNALKPRQLVKIVANILKQPSLLNEWRKGNIIGQEVFFEGAMIQPTLTTIAVDADFQGKGIGMQLVIELENFFKKKRIPYYRLDTLSTNSVAQKFYETLGFQKIENRADSIVYIKKITYE